MLIIHVGFRMQLVLFHVVLQGLSQIGWQLALFISAVELNLDAVVAVLQTVAVPAVLEE